MINLVLADGYQADLMKRDAEVNRSPLRGAWKHDRRDLKYSLLASVVNFSRYPRYRARARVAERVADWIK